jgi:hypothetical protein
MEGPGCLPTARKHEIISKNTDLNIGNRYFYQAKNVPITINTTSKAKKYEYGIRNDGKMNPADI